MRTIRGRVGWCILLAGFAAAAGACGSPDIMPPPIDPCAVDGCPAAQPLPGTWRDAAGMPTPRREMPAVLLNGLIYVTGGFDDDLVVLRTVEAYDPVTDRWTTLPPLPSPRHHHGAAAVEGKLYVLGGYETLGPSHHEWRVTNTVFEYDPAAGEWRERKPMPVLRAAMAVAVHDRQIYLFGGADREAETATTFIYDPASDEWREGAPLRSGREHVFAAVIGDDIYLAGGRRLNSGNNPGLDIFSPRSNSWRSASRMIQGRSGHGMAAMNGRLYVLGGEQLVETMIYDSVEEYDPATDTWRQIKPLSGARSGPGAVAIGNRLHLIGGGPGAGAQHEVLTVP